MPRLSIAPIFIREVLGQRTLPREPEPDLVMEGDQVEAYAKAGRIDGVMASAYLFHTARISQVIQGCEEVLDLGCGPATQLGQVAQLNPAVHFTGLDLSEDMIGDACRHRDTLKLDKLDFRKCDITCLDGIGDQSMDAVISTMALHHLPRLEHLEACFREIARVLKPGGAVYLTDFGRLKQLRSVIFFAYMNAEHQPHLFSLDYERSLRAAFLKEEFADLAARLLPSNVVVQSTFKVPFLVIAKTPDKPLPEATGVRLREMRKQLQPRYRKDLDELRLFFKLGGLGNDPFA